MFSKQCKLAFEVIIKILAFLRLITFASARGGGGCGAGVNDILKSFNSNKPPQNRIWSRGPLFDRRHWSKSATVDSIS